MSAERRAARAEVLADVSEWAAQELVVALSITSTAAEALLTRSLTLVHRLPRTLAALEVGSLHAGHLWPMLDKVAPIADGKVRAEVESALLIWAAGRVTTPSQLGAKATRMVLARNARNAAARLTAALRERGVSMRPDAVDGMAAVTVLLGQPEARALYDALGRYADALDDEPVSAGPGSVGRRTRGQKMADCLLDLVLRPGETHLAPVQAQLTLVASVTTMAGGDAPGEIDGEPVPAEMVRALARALGLLPEEGDGPDHRSVAEQPEVLVPPEPVPDVVLSAEAAPVAETEQRELDVWWAEGEERVLLMGWQGEEPPPSDQLERIGEREACWQASPPPAGWEDCLPLHACERTETMDLSDEWEFAGGVPGLPDGAGAREAPRPDDCPVGWAAADHAVTCAGTALLQLEQAVGRARREVAAVEVAEATDETGWKRSSAGRLSAAQDSLTALTEATAGQRAALAQLLDRTAGGGLVDRPRIAVTSALTGALLALTDSGELRRRSACPRPACRRNPRRCTHHLRGQPGLRPPPPTEGYRPVAALDRWVRARDRCCRFPGCRARVPRGGELDHDRRWPDGPTSAANLAGYCTPHHRGKHQAPGWRHQLRPDGTLTVVTPTGLAAVTTPPPY